MGKDAILVREILQLNDLIAKQAQPIHEGPELKNLLRLAVSDA